MSITRQVLAIPGAPFPTENPLPHFRGRARPGAFASDGSLSAAEQEHLGENTAFRVLPYCMQSEFTKNRSLREYESIVLENEHLCAQFLPQLGGRLYSLFDKNQQRELLFKNPVFQPANLAIRDAWFSGGVEWNIAQTGHTYSTCDDIYCARVQNPHGEDFLRVYDYVRTTGLFWQIDFHLPPHARALYAHVRICNDKPHAVPLYWWTNTAITEEKRVRIFSCTDEVIYINPNSLQKEGGAHAYGHAKLPELPSMPGIDVTYPQNSRYTNEFFFQNGPDVHCPWEAAAYDDGFLFLERSTQPLCTRKMFCWGSHTGGRNWLDHLSEPGRGAYVEIQAGLAPTQVHGMQLGAGQTVEFTQAFSCAETSPAQTHTPDWHTAQQCVERAVCAALSAEDLDGADAQFQACSLLPCGELLHLGHGWGFLESERRRAAYEPTIPAALCFPRKAMGAQELCWLPLLSSGTVEPLAPGGLPTSWMTDPCWLPYLEQALARMPDSAALRIHLGVLLYENGDEAAAVAHWQAAGDFAIAHRNLSVAAAQRGDMPLALREIACAFRLQQSANETNASCTEIAREYLALLLQNDCAEQAWSVYCALPPQAAADERMMITASAAALTVGDDAFLDRAFAYPFAVIREGETQMVDLWFRKEAARTAAQAGRKDLDVVEQELRASAQPPKNIDYRLTNT